MSLHLLSASSRAACTQRIPLLPSLALAAVLLTTAFPALAQKYDSAPTSAILFKNNLGWIVEEGRGKTDSEWVSTRLHGKPVVGTLRLAPVTETKVIELKTYPTWPGGRSPVLAAFEAAAVGSKATVTAAGKTVEGRILGVSTGTVASESMLSLDVDGTLVLVPTAKIERVETATPAIPAAAGDDRLRLRISPKEGNFQIRASYLTGSVGWVPVYQLDLAGKDKGQLSLDAIVVNDAMDFDSASIQFATGEATFPMRDMPSPLFDPGITAEETMRTVLGGVGNAMQQDVDNNPVYNRMNYVQAVAPNRFQPLPASPQSGEETHLYGPVELSLKKGERSRIGLGAGEVPADLIYYWKVPENVDTTQDRNDVWLAARMTNRLSFPLTTGTVLVTRSGRPVGQGFFTYTHVGGEAVVPISIASSVLASPWEQEDDRDRNTVNFRGARYDKVRIKGTLSLRNLQDKPVTVRVEKPVSGKVTASSDSPASDERFVSAYDPNPKTTLRWTVEVKAGEKRDLDYTYETFVIRYNQGSSY
ncbi:MAG: DUF4139 domain-containing protein [Deltaproteobacteria bacterium]|nr:DUF4139 domain-containing protein [Deltaproteobacteria bacterium]